jgi:hypothetical protein
MRFGERRPGVAPRQTALPVVSYTTVRSGVRTTNGAFSGSVVGGLAVEYDAVGQDPDLAAGRIIRPRLGLACLRNDELVHHLPLCLVPASVASLSAYIDRTERSL